MRAPIDFCRVARYNKSMIAKVKAKILFKRLLSRPDIDKAYALTDPSDSWYSTLKKVHESLDEIRKYEHFGAEIVSDDGLTLRAVVYPARIKVEPSADRAVAPTMIFVHGYTSHAERESAFPGLFYMSLGYNLILPYQRAHGKSDGKYITFGAAEKGDVLKWIDEAKRLFPGTSVVIHGLSMGGGIALQLCDVPDEQLKCIIADAPSFGIEGLFRFAAHECDKKREDRIYEELCRIFNGETGKSVQSTRIEPHLAKAVRPIYLTVGSLEDVVPELRVLKSASPIKYVELPGCSHGNGFYKQTELYQNELKAFLAENM